MKRICLALDLKDDPSLISEYEKYHREVWPGIIDSIRKSGVELMEIYRTGNRLFMIMEVNEDYSPEKKSTDDASNPLVQEWENLMWKFQQPLPGSKQDEKWIVLNKIFELSA